MVGLTGTSAALLSHEETASVSENGMKLRSCAKSFSSSLTVAPKLLYACRQLQ